jgi:hypothetical protein
MPLHSPGRLSNDPVSREAFNPRGVLGRRTLCRRVALLGGTSAATRTATTTGGPIDGDDNVWEDYE